MVSLTKKYNDPKSLDKVRKYNRKRQVKAQKTRVIRDKNNHIKTQCKDCYNQISPSRLRLKLKTCGDFCKFTKSSF